MLDQNQFLILLIVVSFLIMGGAAFITREVRAKVWTLGYPTVPYVHHHHHDEYRSLHRCAACGEGSGGGHNVTVAPVVNVPPSAASLLPMQANWSMGTGGSGLLQRDSFVAGNKSHSGKSSAASHKPPESEPETTTPAAADAAAADADEPPRKDEEQQHPDTTGKDAEPAKDSFEDAVTATEAPAPPVNGTDGFRDHHVSLTPFHNQSRFQTSLKSLR